MVAVYPTRPRTHDAEPAEPAPAREPTRLRYFAKAHEDLILDPRLATQPTALRLYLLLDQRAGRRGWYFFEHGDREAADLLGVEERTLRDAKRLLRSADYIDTIRLPAYLGTRALYVVRSRTDRSAAEVRDEIAGRERPAVHCRTDRQPNAGPRARVPFPGPRSFLDAAAASAPPLEVQDEPEPDPVAETLHVLDDWEPGSTADAAAIASGLTVEDVRRIDREMHERHETEPIRCPARYFEKFAMRVRRERSRGEDPWRAPTRRDGRRRASGPPAASGPDPYANLVRREGGAA